MRRNVEKITVDMQAERLPQDLERYRQQALDLGATQAAIVKAEDIPVDERVILKCRIPRCFGYGAGAHCPPHALTPAELRELLTQISLGRVFHSGCAAGGDCPGQGHHQGAGGGVPEGL